MSKPVSIHPSSFTDSYLLQKSVGYVVPEDDEKRSRFSVSGMPTKILNTITYVAPSRLGGKWHKSHANVERFLISVGIPLLEKATEKCSDYCSLMTSAVDIDDDGKQLHLRTSRFLYSVEDMRIVGGRETPQGGIAVQCLGRDVQAIKEVQIKLGLFGVSQSVLVVLSLVWALSSDSDCQVVTAPIQKLCSDVVNDFRNRIIGWERLLDGLH